MIYFKVHRTPEGEIIAMCDSELLGKVYREGKTEIDLKSYSDFYKGELLGEEAAGKLGGLDDFYTANIVGERSVNIYARKGIIKKQEVRKVKGIPYVHLFKIYK